MYRIKITVTGQFGKVLSEPRVNVSDESFSTMAKAQIIEKSIIEAAEKLGDIITTEIIFIPHNN